MQLTPLAFVDRVRRSVILLMLLVFCVFGMSGTPVEALSDDDMSSINRDTVWLDYNSALTCESGSGDLSLTNTETEKYIWDFLSDPVRNLKDFQVAGIMGNMVHESGLEPQRQQSIFDRKVPAEDFPDPAGASGWGLVQWTPGTKIIDNVTPVSDANSAQTQMEFLWDQLEGSGPVPEDSRILPQIRDTSNILQAVLAFQGNTSVGGPYIGYERPLDQHGSVPDRVAAAKMLLEKYSESSPVYSAECGPGDLAGGGLTQTVLAYAWPDHEEAPFLDLRPAYAQAVEAADEDGIYRGGTVRGVGGIDCGGFLTLLMVNSGFEPNYNHGGKLSDGAGSVSGGAQEPWLMENWQRINPESTQDMQAGDVAISDVHTYVYVGDIPGFESDTASASYTTTSNGGRAPMAGKEAAADPDFRWYRKE